MTNLKVNKNNLLILFQIGLFLQPTEEKPNRSFLNNTTNILKYKDDSSQLKKILKNIVVNYEKLINNKNVLVKQNTEKFRFYSQFNEK